jgi:hypothetical protein
VQVIREAKSLLEKTPYTADAFSLQLAQVGNDLEAREFLEWIDENREIGSLVDVCSFPSLFAVLDTDALLLADHLVIRARAGQLCEEEEPRQLDEGTLDRKAAFGPYPQRVRSGGRVVRIQDVRRRRLLALHPF